MSPVRCALLALVLGACAPEPYTRPPPITVTVPAPSLPPEGATGTAWWAAERAERQARVDAWRAAWPAEEAWFRHHTVGSIGLPMIAFRALPELMPDLWGDYAAELGMTQDPGAVLPRELSFGDGPKPVAPLPGLRQLKMQVITVSCASCHVGYVEGPDGAVLELLGAPHPRVDLLAYRRKVALTARDDRFTYENIQAVLDRHPLGWAYGAAYTRQERLDRWIFAAKGAEILAVLREKIDANEARLEDTLLRTTYAEVPALLHGGLPGQTDGYSVIAARLLPEEAAQAEGEAALAQLRAWLPPSPGFVDFRSVWYQTARTRAQWDGSVRAPTMRNLGAAYGIIGSPEHVDYENAVMSGRFTEGLPPPPYPFDLDAAEIRAGAAIYAQACASCHDTEAFMSAAQLGVDDGRARVLSPMVRALAVEALRAACREPDAPDCQVADDQIVAPPDAAGPGYIAPPLRGVWASAPYLHNGSVPTLEQLLVPASRVPVFYRGALAYDQEQGGFAWAEPGPGRVAFDTDRAGCASTGHADPAVFAGGLDFEADPAARRALIAYLLSL